MMRRVAVLPIVCLAAVVLGCLEFDGQTVRIHYDREADRLVFVVNYQGLYAGKQMPGVPGLQGVTDDPELNLKEGQDELKEAVESHRLALCNNWPMVFAKDEMLKALEKPDSEELSPEMAADARWLVEHIEVLNAGFYRDVDGRLCGAQVVLIEPASEFLKTAGRLLNEALIKEAAQAPDDEPLQFIAKAARAGHQWLRLDGDSLIIRVPMSEELLREVRGELADKVDSAEDGLGDVPAKVLKAVLQSPVLVWHDGNVLMVKIGYTSSPSSFVTRPREGGYEANLVPYVRETQGFHLDDVVARYLLDPKAPAETESERAARFMASTVDLKGRLRATMTGAKVGYAEALHEEMLNPGRSLLPESDEQKATGPTVP